MTVGIAALAEMDKAIIFASDRMIGVGSATADLPLVTKGGLFHEKWIALYSGNDIARVPPIIRKVGDTLESEVAPTVEEVTQAFLRAYQEERERVAIQTILSPFGLNMREFMSLWATSQNPELTDMKRKIQDLYFDCTFLIGGFGPEERPHIFTVNPPAIEDHYDPVGFWSIGSGADAALSSLMFRRVNKLMTLPQVVYHVAEAKFMAESCMGVGKDTLLLVLKREGTWGFIMGNELRQLRQIWEAEGRAPVPPNLDGRISSLIELEQVVPSKPKKHKKSKPSNPEKSEGQP